MAKAKHLVIVESPSKAHTVGNILGADYKVMASVGHIRDLKKHYLSVDVKHDFEPVYEVPAEKKRVVADLCKAAEQADCIYLASDPDREGEAIAWHLKQVLSEDATNQDKPFLRVQYNEVTPRAVKAALDNPGEIDIDRVDAQQARRVLDRLVGYRVSPLVRSSVAGGQSAGRVQSVALRLVCDREKLIRDFVPESYWLMGADLAAKGVTFTTRLARIDGKKAEIRDEESATLFNQELQSAKQFKVQGVKVQERQKRPYPPFRTSTLQQSASSVCGLAPVRTMSIAQKLYEAGLITYMRTDSSAISADAQKAAAAFLTDKFGASFVPPKPPMYGSRKDAQGAHEAIRPTDISKIPNSLTGFSPQEIKVYDLIWKRFAASQMKPAILSQRTVEFVPVSEGLTHVYSLTASKTDVQFEGFYKIMKPTSKAKKVEDAAEDDEGGDESASLPMLEADELADLVKCLSERKETTPPPRFNEASLIKTLEEDGVGRPSTYATIVETLDKRKYVTKENRQMVPTEAGLKVNDFLVAEMEPMVNVNFTAEMETELDRIEAGEVTWKEVLRAFYAQLQEWLKADPKVLKVIFEQFDQVSQWREPIERGRHVYDDLAVVTEMKAAAQADTGVTKSQVGLLLQMAARYREQMPQVEQAMQQVGLVLPPAPPQVDESHIEERFEALAPVELSPFDSRFVASLKRQWSSGRPFSVKQLAALDRVLVRNAGQISDYQTLVDKIGLNTQVAETAEVQDNGLAQALIEAGTAIQTWDAPTKKGNRVYDDQDFYQSLARQFETKKSLSPAQSRALTMLIARYSAQIPQFAQLTEQFGIKPRKAVARKAAAEKLSDQEGDQPTEKTPAKAKTKAKAKAKAPAKSKAKASAKPSTAKKTKKA